ncbi:MAG: arsenate reductase ArsC [Verrucomicrobiota bacterium]
MTSEPPKNLPRVLFVCVENSCRSQMAEGFARMHGADVMEAFSSGSRPSGIVNARAIEFMQERGYDLSRHSSKGLNEIPQEEYAYAITMGCGDECPFVRAQHREDWQLPDPKHLAPEEFRRIRDLIETKVKELIARVSAEAK